jgi:hypothetical protein
MRRSNAELWSFEYGWISGPEIPAKNTRSGHVEYLYTGVGNECTSI